MIHERDLDKWDRRFMKLAAEVSTWSKDPSTQTGAVVVSPNRQHIALGFNGFPSRTPDDPALLNDRNQKYPRIIHCEMNSVRNARGPVDGYTLYTHPCISCERCASHMVAYGIARVVCPLPTADMESRWANLLAMARQIFSEAGVEVVEYLPENREEPAIQPNNAVVKG